MLLAVRKTRKGDDLDSWVGEEQIDGVRGMSFVVTGRTWVGCRCSGFEEPLVVVVLSAKSL